MRKWIALALVLLALGGAAFADDAKVMPRMVGRLYLAPTFAFTTGSYDDDGTLQTDTKVKLFNLGAALEFGVIDWVTAAVQWAPGWTAVSAVNADSLSGDPNVNGVADLFVGAKVQIVGEKAPVANDRFRVAVAPGIKIPLPGPDYKDELKNRMAGDPYTVQNQDTHVLGAGARLYVDYQIVESFFLNFYTEAIFYPMKGKLKDSGLTGYGAAYKVDQTNQGYYTALSNNNALSLSDEVTYGADLTFEVEGVYTRPMAEGISLTAGLPVWLKTSPKTKYPEAKMTAAGQTAYGMSIPGYDAAVDDAIADTKGLNAGGDTLLFGFRPNVSVFLTKTPLPLEFKLQYNVPVWGKNATAMHSITLQVKAYFALPGAAL